MCASRKLIVLSCIALGLAACTSAEEQQQADATACQGYGFAPGTPEFANCMQQEQLARSRPGGVYPSMGIGIGGGSYGGGGAGIGFGF